MTTFSPESRVALLCPTRGVVIARAIHCLIADVEDARRHAGVAPAWFWVEGQPMPACRHQCVQKMSLFEMTHGRFDYVLWWDDDQAPPEGTLRRYLDVLRTADSRAAMVTGHTWVRRGERRLPAVTALKPSDAEVQLARGAGLFYALIRRDVLDDLPVESTMRSAFGEDWEYTTALVARGRHLLYLPRVEIPHLRVVRRHDRDAQWAGSDDVEAQ